MAHDDATTTCLRFPTLRCSACAGRLTPDGRCLPCRISGAKGTAQDRLDALEEVINTERHGTLQGVPADQWMTIRDDGSIYYRGTRLGCMAYLAKRRDVGELVLEDAVDVLYASGRFATIGWDDDMVERELRRAMSDYEAAEPAFVCTICAARHFEQHDECSGCQQHGTIVAAD